MHFSAQNCLLEHFEGAKAFAFNLSLGCIFFLMEIIVSAFDSLLFKEQPGLPKFVKRETYNKVEIVLFTL